MSILIPTPHRLKNKQEEKVTYDSDGDIIYLYMWKNRKEFNKFFNIEDWEGSENDQSLPAGAI